MNPKKYSMTLDALKDLSPLAMRLYIAILLYSETDGHICAHDLDGEVRGIVGEPSKEDYREAYRDLLELHLITYDGTFTRPVTTITLYDYNAEI